MPETYAYQTQYHVTPVNFAQTGKTAGHVHQKLSQSEQTDVVDSERLPLEEGKVLTVKPDSKGNIPEGNCCQPVDRSDQAIAFNKDTAAQFAEAFIDVVSMGEELVFDDIKEYLKDYPDQLNPLSAFGVEDEDRVGSTLIEGLFEHYDLDGTPSNDAGDFPEKDAKEMFRGIVNYLEQGRLISRVALGVMLGTDNGHSSSFSRKLDEWSKDVDEFYHDALRPARYEYEVFSRVPVPQRTVRHLVRDMIAKLRDFREAYRALRAAGVEYDPREEMQAIAEKIRGLTDDEQNGNQLLRQIIRDSRRIMVKYNREIVRRELTDNEEVMAAYEKASLALFRANESKSVTCHAMWGLNRRNIRPTAFERRVLDQEEYPERFETNSSREFKQAIRALRQGTRNEGEVVDHREGQLERIDKYLETGTNVFLDLVRTNWRQH